MRHRWRTSSVADPIVWSCLLLFLCTLGVTCYKAATVGGPHVHVTNPLRAATHRPRGTSTLPAAPGLSSSLLSRPLPATRDVDSTSRCVAALAQAGCAHRQRRKHFVFYVSTTCTTQLLVNFLLNSKTAHNLPREQQSIYRDQLGQVFFIASRPNGSDQV